MDTFIVVIVFAIVAFAFRKKRERKRIALLGGHLGNYQIEKLMEELSEGYLRALATADPQRRDLIWNQLRSAEVKLSEQFASFAAAFARVAEDDTRVSKLPLAILFADKWLPAASFDFRKALSLHAAGIRRAVHERSDSEAKGRAFVLSAELFLMQHTCHWFCKSKTIASARLLVRHKTSYKQVLEALPEETRKAYLKLLGR